MNGAEKKKRNCTRQQKCTKKCDSATNMKRKNGASFSVTFCIQFQLCFLSFTFFLLSLSISFSVWICNVCYHSLSLFIFLLVIPQHTHTYHTEIYRNQKICVLCSVTTATVHASNFRRICIRFHMGFCA